MSENKKIGFLIGVSLLSILFSVMFTFQDIKTDKISNIEFIEISLLLFICVFLIVKFLFIDYDEDDEK